MTWEALGHLWVFVLQEGVSEKSQIVLMHQPEMTGKKNPKMSHPQYIDALAQFLISNVQVMKLKY